MSVSPRSLIAKLNGTSRTSLEAAAGLCLSRSNYEVDIEHLFLKLIEVTGSDLSRIWRQFDIDPTRLTRDITKSVDKMRTGNSRTPALSHRIVRLLTEAWTIGSLEYNSPQIRSGYLLIALISHEDLSRLAREISPEFARLSGPRPPNRPCVTASVTNGTMRDDTGPRDRTIVARTRRCGHADGRVRRPNR